MRSENERVRGRATSSVNHQRPIFARDARQSEVTENDCIFNSREPILHLMRGEWNAADELVRVKLRAYHGSTFECRCQP
jgi:tRNA(Phe) wybutosine-synthesizing methylase Tyw3